DFSLSPFPENIGTTLEFVPPFALQLQILRKEFHFLFLGKIVAPGEVLGELAGPELNSVCPCKVGSCCCHPLLVIEDYLEKSKANKELNFKKSCPPWPCGRHFRGHISRHLGQC
ncbi:hypothetical protein, partial [Salmonella sp. s57402]|uniref:hypothetical protein n=1 Tax=Salmonella sp. s57402 TaxID=3159695 RepID=UPI0039808D75